QTGAIYGNAFAGIGQNIGTAIQQQQDPRTKLNQLALEEAQRRKSDMDALDKAYATGVDRDAILNALPGHLRPTVQKQFTEADEASQKVQKLRDETAVAERDYFGSLAAGVKPFLSDPDGGLSATMVALQHAKQAGYPQADQLWAQIK